jgi:hypothetical protein
LYAKYGDGLLIIKGRTENEKKPISFSVLKLSSTSRAYSACKN